MWRKVTANKQCSRIKYYFFTEVIFKVSKTDKKQLCRTQNLYQPGSYSVNMLLSFSKIIQWQWFKVTFHSLSFSAMMARGNPILFRGVTCWLQGWARWILFSINCLQAQAKKLIFHFHTSILQAKICYQHLVRDTTRSHQRRTNVGKAICRQIQSLEKRMMEMMMMK